MKELDQLLESQNSDEFIAAYHCFGDKATNILNSIDQPYKDITHWHTDNFHSGKRGALFVFTDNAESYVTEIDTCIKQYKDMVKRIFILDLHASHHHKKFKEKWEFYNIFTTNYSTVQENIRHYLLFFKHFIETVGLNSMDFNDFKDCMFTSTFITAGQGSPLKEAFESIPHKNARSLMIGFELQNNPDKVEKLVEFSDFIDQLPIMLEYRWQIASNYGNPHIEYIVGFDVEPSFDTANS